MNISLTVCNILKYLFTFFLFFYLPVQAQLRLHAVPMHLKTNKDFTLQIPAGYDISVAAEGLERPRFFAKSPDGRLFITDMHNRDDNKKGRILILDNCNEKEHRFLNVAPFMDQLHNPNQMHIPEQTEPLFR